MPKTESVCVFGTVAEIAPRITNLYGVRIVDAGFDWKNQFNVELEIPEGSEFELFHAVWGENDLGGLGNWIERSVYCPSC